MSRTSTVRPHRRSALAPGLAWAAIVTLITGCAASSAVAPEPSGPISFSGEPTAEQEQSAGARLLEPWQRALLPQRDGGDLWVTHMRRGVSLACGGREYASSRRTEAMASVGLVLLPTALREGAPTGLRWAILGVGSGVELSTALALEPEGVDLLEPSADMIASSLQTVRDAEVALPGSLDLLEGRYARDELRVLADAPPGPAPTYDVIVHSRALTTLSRPYRLYGVERLRALAGLLAPGGRLVMHLQLWEIDAETVRSLLRTFAEAFPHVVVWTPATSSLDAILVGSNEALSFHVPTLRALHAVLDQRPLQELFELGSPTDVTGRVLFGSREEVLSYVGEGQVFDSEHPMGRDALPQRPPLPSEEPTEEEVIAWNEAYDTFRERNGFDAAFVSAFYDLSWPYGDPCPTPPECRLVRGFGRDAEGARVLAELALSRLLFTGRSTEALFTASRRLGETPEARHARRLYDLFAASDGPRSPLAALVSRGPLRQELAEVDRMLAAGDALDAYERLDVLLASPVERRNELEFARLWAACAAELDGAAEALDELVVDYPSLLLLDHERLRMLAGCRRRVGRIIAATGAMELSLRLEERGAGPEGERQGGGR